MNKSSPNSSLTSRKKRRNETRMYGRSKKQEKHLRTSIRGSDGNLNSHHRNHELSNSIKLLKAELKKEKSQNMSTLALYLTIKLSSSMYTYFLVTSDPSATSLSTSLAF